MILRNRILNLLDTKRRREAVRALASARNQIAEAKKTFREIREKRTAILDHFAELRSQGSTPKPMIECLSAAKPLASLATTGIEQFTMPFCKLTLKLHRTQENKAFRRRCVAFQWMFDRLVENSVADMRQWLAELTPDDSELEALIVRLQEADNYFAFSYAEFKPDLEFKRRMSAYGQFYEAREDLSTFPHHVASWLRHKRYEWFVVGMEKNREVTLVWVNKGESNERVYLGVPASAPVPTNQLLLPRPAEWVPRSAAPVIRRAVDDGYTSILMFHNHPQSQKELFRGWRISPTPSETDLETAKRMAKNLGQLGINYLAFICQSGDPYLYHFSLADKFLMSSDSAQGELRF